MTPNHEFDETWESREREDAAGALEVCACFCFLAVVVFAVLAIVMAMTQ